MSQGLEVWNAAGVKTLSVTDRLSRLIYYSRNRSGSVYLPTFDSTRGVYGFHAVGVIAASALHASSFDNSTKILTWSANYDGYVYAYMTQ